MAWLRHSFSKPASVKLRIPAARVALWRMAVIKWGLIAFGAGMLLIVIEIMMARKKKGGITATDKKSMVGLFWISVMVSGLVMFVVAMSD